MVATKAEKATQGGVALVHWTSERWHLEGTKRYGPNVIRTVLVEGDRQTVLVGVYIPPSEGEDSVGKTVQWVEAACKEDPRPKIILGDLNASLEKLTTRVVDVEHEKEGQDGKIKARLHHVGR